MKRFLTAAVIGLASSIGVGAATDEGKIVFRHDSTPEYSVQYRIPAVASVRQNILAGVDPADIRNGKFGRIVAIGDYRHCRGDIGAGRIDLHISCSDDGGRTWSKPADLVDAEGNPVAKGSGAPGNDITNLDCGYGDAALVSDRDTGELLLIACCGRMNVLKSTRSNPQPSARWWSRDGGKTWTRPDYTHWQQVYSLFDNNGGIDGQFIASGRIMQSRYIKKGDYYRIYAATMVQNDHFRSTRNYVLYSDDFGRSWQVLGGAATAAIPAHGDEAKVEELPDGSVLISGRGYEGNRNFNIFKYKDAAAGTGEWMTPVLSSMGQKKTLPACNGEIMVVPVVNVKSGKSTYLALQSLPYGPNRTNVGILWKALEDPTSYDTPAHFAEGWKKSAPIYKGGSAYSTLEAMFGDKIGIFLEAENFGRDYCLVHYPVLISEITKGKYRGRL